MRSNAFTTTVKTRMSGGFLCGKLAVVTGGSGTIGQAIAKALVSSGASVVLTARRPEKLASVREKILESWKGDNLPRIYCIASDVSKEESVVELFQKIDGLNQNKWYAAKYDRRHILSVVAIYDATKRWSFSANFSLSSGIAVTFPNARYEYGGLIVPHNTNDTRNNYRVPAYHRLDLSATWDRAKPNRKWAGSWVFSIYNLYSRNNAFTVYFRQNKDDAAKTEAVNLSIFGAMIPAVTYNFKF